jgi:NitT/TauT family transport system ATP-binding protein
VSERAAVVSLRDVAKQFGRGDVVALRGIELEVQPGEFVSLIGPSGCGKSTLLRIIGDLIAPSGGEVVVNGKSAHQARLDRDYGIVFQDAVLYDWRTVARNIALPLEMLGWDRRRRAARPRADQPRRADRVRGPPSLAALGWHAAARFHRPRALV